MCFHIKMVSYNSSSGTYVSKAVNVSNYTISYAGQEKLCCGRGCGPLCVRS